MQYSQADHIRQIIDNAQHIVIIQADNPDADSLGSSLALEHILEDQGKQTTMYCGVEIPGYLHHLPGWDRVVRDIPAGFDASIIVDASTMTLLEKLQQSGQMGWIASKPCVVLDHHAIVENKIPFAAVTLCDDTVSSTGELIYLLAKQLSWPVNPEAAGHIMSAILGDTQGLTNDLASAQTYRIMGELIELGVDRPLLEERRREFSKMPLEIYTYKAELIRRTEFYADNRIAIVSVPQDEINRYSPLYNPVALIQGDMGQVTGVQLSIVLKTYDDGKITGAIRANHGYAVAGKLAESLGGGGHAYASGFKIVNGKPFNEVKSECIRTATELLNELQG